VPLIVPVLGRLAALPASSRSRHAGAAFRRVIVDQPPGAVCLSVGGGPTLVHPRLINLNLVPLANVQVVGNAYTLPIHDDSVDAVYCEAVLEHLEFPDAAVTEMLRVLRPGGQVLAVTPLLQAYHGYPDHYQNFTLRGHVRLFERAGFEVIDSGPCNGPSFALLDLLSNYFREYLPSRFLSRSAFYLTRAAAAPLALLDRVLLARPNAHVLASTTFVHARRPAR
jgi:SAM-dependent methyltransferase